MALMPVERLDAVYISHGHPDHSADLNPLLRARALGGGDPGPLSVFAPHRALDAVLALDRPGMLDAAIRRYEFDPGDGFEIGPFEARTSLLPHWVPNAAVRLGVGDRSLVYTGDGGPAEGLVTLAQGADVLIAEATYAAAVPAEDEGNLSSARDAGQQAARSGVGRLVLTHLWAGADAGEWVEVAGWEFGGEVGVAGRGLSFEV
jgi:ribonuclease BN (tRNA processing enzyme)